MMRLFVGLPIPEIQTRDLAALQSGLPGARWVAPEDFHITLAFIGEVSEDVAEDVHAALEERLSRRRVSLEPIALAGLGRFGDARRGARLLYAALEAHPGLAHLRDSVCRVMETMGLYAKRRRYKPHVTLARFRPPGGARVDEAAARGADWSTAPFTPDYAGLYRSRPQCDGARCEILKRYPLQRTAGAPAALCARYAIVNWGESG